MQLQIGTAPDSWGIWFPSDPNQMPWQRFLDEVVEAGYDAVELGPYGYLPTDAKVLRQELEKRKLRVPAAFVMGNLVDAAAWPRLEREITDVGTLLAALEAKHFVLIPDMYSDQNTGRPIGPVTLVDDAWKRMIDTTHKVTDLVRERFGLQLAFHTHAETPIESEDQIEKFLEDTDPKRVSLCFDTGHHAYRGGDSVAFVRRHPDRIGYLHFKNVDPTVCAKVNAERTPFPKAVAMGVFCELSKGAVDFVALRDALREAGYRGWAIVEQDMYPAPFDKPLPIAKRTRTYLREIGMGCVIEDA
ncbi:MAG TPA: TIM barrel protein [Pirellulales bacterium]|nr:TIM barrel protein [Pirellulales bacterium]